MCSAYTNNNYLNYIIPTDLSYFYTFCISYDTTMLISTTIVRLVLFLFIYWILTTNIENFDQYYYFDKTLLVIILLNVVSLLMALTKVPQFKNRTDTKENILL